MLPTDDPKWPTGYHDFRPWRDDGTWQRLHDRRRAGRHQHPTAGGLDRPSVKTTQVPGERGYDTGQNVYGRTRQLVVDPLGVLRAVVVTAASVSDPVGARLLFQWLGGAGKKLRQLWVDGTYRGKLVDWVAAHWQFLLQPVLRSDDGKGFVILPRRWVVEIVFTQMTKPDMLAGWARRNDVADLHVAVGYHHTVDQHHTQLPFPLKRGISEAAPDALTKGLDGTRPASNLAVPVGFASQVLFLADQGLSCLLPLATASLVLLQGDTRMPVGVRQTVQVLGYTRPSFAQMLTPRLECLR
jgi:putative transposase